MFDVDHAAGRVVVTGAAGFIGRHAVAALLDAGHRVTGIDRRPWAAVAGERVVVADLLDPGVDALLARAAGVVHLAGCPGVRDGRPDADRWRRRDNVDAGQAVLDAVPASTPLVVASSSSVYGGAGSPEAPRACREDDVRQPRGGYARSKALLEDRCQLARANGRRVAILRPFTVAGEGQRPDMALARWIQAVRTSQPVRVFGSLERRRDVTDVTDVARAVVAALEGDLDGVCNVGTGRTHRLADLVDAVTAAVGRPARVRVVGASVEEVAATRADTARCLDLLGFVPTTDLATLVARQAAGQHALLTAAG